MIKLIKKGKYSLIETRSDVKVLKLDEAPQSGNRDIFSPPLRREQNPSEAEKTSHSAASSRSKVSAKGDKKTFVWIFAKSIGEMLVTTHRPHKTDQKLAKGEFRIYDVKDDPNLVDQLHLELAIGEGDWQGYLLPTGFPKDNKTRSRIIPTNETISKSK